MAFQFPASPSVGDTYFRFTWDGAAWVTFGGTSSNPDLSALLARISDLEVGLQNPPPVFEGADIRVLTAPTGADGTPSDFNYVVVDKATGEIKTINPGDFIEIE